MEKKICVLMNYLLRKLAYFRRNFLDQEFEFTMETAKEFWVSLVKLLALSQVKSVSAQVDNTFHNNSEFELAFLELVDKTNLSEADHLPNIQEELVELQAQTLGTPWYKYVLGALGVVVIIGGVFYLKGDSIPEPVREFGSSIVETTTSTVSMGASWLIGLFIGDGPLDWTGDDLPSESNIPVISDASSVTSVVGLAEDMSVDDGLALNDIEPILPMGSVASILEDSASHIAECAPSPVEVPVDLEDSASHIAECAPSPVEVPVDLVDTASTFEVPEVTGSNLQKIYGLIDQMNGFQLVDLERELGNWLDALDDEELEVYSEPIVWVLDKLDRAVERALKN